MRTAVSLLLVLLLGQSIFGQTNCVDGRCQVITHINGIPVAQPSLVLQSAFAAAAVETVDMGDRAAFRRAFVLAVRSARERGDLSFGQSLTIRLAMSNPKVMDHVQGALASEAIATGYAQPAKVDWNSLLEFLKQIDWAELLKFIAELVKLFS